MKFAACVYVGLQAAQAANVLALVKDIDVLADVALFGEDAVTKREVLAPKRGKQIADGFVIPGHADLRLPIAKAFKVAAQIDLVRHFSYSTVL